MKNRLAPVSKMLYNTKAARFWTDGSTYSLKLNWWNPIAWIWALTFVVFTFILEGVGGFSRENFASAGFIYSDYWRDRQKVFF